MVRVVVVVLILLTAACSAPSSEKPKAAPSPSPTSTYARQPDAPIQPRSWIATDLDDADAWATEDSILLANDISVVSVDPEKERVRWRLDVAVYGVSAGFGSVWASDGEGGVVRRLDPTTGRTTKTLRFDGYPIGLVTAPDGVWVAEHHDGSVARIDPESNRVADRTKVGPAGNSGPHQLAIGDGHLYVDMSNANTVVELDLDSGKVARTFELPDDFAACGPMRVDKSVLWVTACLEKEKLARIDLVSADVKVIDIGSWAGGFLIRGDTVWLSTKTVPPDFSRTGGAIVGVDRSDGRRVARLRTDTTGYGSVEAFGSWWLPTEGGVARYRPSDLDGRR